MRITHKTTHIGESETLVEYEHFPGQKLICNPIEKAQEEIPEQVIILGATTVTGEPVAYDDNQEDLVKVEILERIHDLSY